MEKTLTLATYIEQYEKDKYILKTEKYVPYATKIAACERITRSTCYETNSETGQSILHFSSVTKKMLRILTIIDLYTNIKIDYTNGFVEYDLFSSNTWLISDIIEKIPEREIKEFDDILQLTIDDIIFNESQTKQLISKTIVDTAKVCKPELDKLADTLSRIDVTQLVASIDKIDSNKLLKFFSKMK